ncbi:MAG: NAD-dependent epimerase/dehydratase family protein [Beijerinckiaceae bacterium]
MTAKVWVTGGSGFVGRHLQAAFAAEHPDVAILATGNEIDVTDFAALTRVLASFEPDAVVHLAAVAAPSEAKADPERAWAINLDGSRRLARAIMTTGAGRCRLVFAGSSEAYGASFKLGLAPITETAPLNPLSLYGATKAAADIALRQMAHDGLDLCCFRAFNHTGRGQSAQYVVAAFASQIAAIIKGNAPPVIQVGNLSALRDFTHVKDIVRAYMLAALDPEPFTPGDAYNLASGVSVPISAILDRLVAAAGCRITVEIDPARLRPNEIEIVSANVSAVDRRLGWRAGHSLDELVEDVLAGALAEA